MTQQHIPEAKKMGPGDELHLTLLMAPFSLNFFTGQDRQHLLAFGRAAFEAGQAAAQQAVQAAEPDGWKLVPDVDNMTDEQAEAIADVARVCGGGALGIYRAALAAAPAHPAEGVPVQAVLDGGTPGPWRVRKRTNDAGEVLDCFVTAPDCQGLAYAAEILGDDEYRDGIERKLADCELIVATVNAYRAAIAATQPAAQGVATTGYIAPKGRYVPPVLFSPYTGEPRDARDIASDPHGILIVPPGTALAAQAKQSEAIEAARKGGCGCCSNACADRADGCRHIHENPSAADMKGGA